MKKDQPRQDRRRRALERFKIIVKPEQDEAQRTAYLARKNQELASLKSSLGL